MSSPVLRGMEHVEPAVFFTFGPIEPPPPPPTEPAPPDPATILDQARREAEESGYADGYARGRADAERELREQIERLRTLVDGAVHDVRAAVLALEPEVVELALTVAGRVVEREITEHPELVVDVVRAALAAAATLPLVRVRVHPRDHQVVASVWSSLAPATEQPPVQLVADEDVQAGGCIIDTSSGLVDAQPRTRLDELRMQVLPILGGSR